MRSASLNKWFGARSSELDEIEQAHSAVGGTAPGRRWVTRQLNHSYALILSSQFQGFCRDLHSEVVDHFVASVSPATLQSVLRLEFTMARKLDKGNPTPGNLGSDFGRLGLRVWPRIHALDARNADRQAKLERLCIWRNAIAHQDIDPSKLQPRALQLGTLKSWRRACSGLARSFDSVMHAHVSALLGSAPW